MTMVNGAGVEQPYQYHDAYQGSTCHEHTQARRGVYVRITAAAGFWQRPVRVNKPSHRPSAFGRLQAGPAMCHVDFAGRGAWDFDFRFYKWVCGLKRQTHAHIRLLLQEQEQKKTKPKQKQARPTCRCRCTYKVCAMRQAPLNWPLS